MSNDLDRRAALAMGWSVKDVGEYFGDFAEDIYIGNGSRDRFCFEWSPSTDRNDLAELIGVVELLVLDYELSNKLIDLNKTPMRTNIFVLLADPAIICAAAVEVLEAANG